MSRGDLAHRFTLTYDSHGEQQSPRCHGTSITMTPENCTAPHLEWSSAGRRKKGASCCLRPVSRRARGLSPPKVPGYSFACVSTWLRCYGKPPVRHSRAICILGDALHGSTAGCCDLPLVVWFFPRPQLHRRFGRSEQLGFGQRNVAKGRRWQ